MPSHNVPVPYDKYRTIDGLEYVHNIEGSSDIDILVVDVVDSAAEPDSALELPPAEFVTSQFLTAAKSKLTSDGWIVLNVLANREKLGDITRLFLELFTSVYVCATDPNYVFFLSNSNVCEKEDISETDIYKLAVEFEYDQDLCHSVLEDIRITKEHVDDERLLGWFKHDLFLQMLDNPSVDI